MSPAGYSDSRISKKCAACGMDLDARVQEGRYKRAFTCQSITADTTDGLPDSCWLNQNNGSEDTKAALAAMSEVSKCDNFSTNKASSDKRVEVLMNYISEVGSGEPSLTWYREQLRHHTANVVNAALATLPYWKIDELKIPSLVSIGPIDKCVQRVRENANDELADLLAGYVEHHYELMEFGFEHGLYGKANPVKISTLHQRIYKLANYLEWIHGEGHQSLQSANRSTLDEYITEKGIHSSAVYQISNFYTWAKKKHRFIPNIGFNMRGRNKQRDDFPFLKLGVSQDVFQRICSHPEPQGRALALLSLLYAQTADESISLKRSDLIRDQATGLWMIARPDSEAFRVEPEVSEALDECIALADKHTRKVGLKEEEYIFPGRVRGHLGRTVAHQRIENAAGVKPNLLRRTSIVNIFRGGQKTMGTVVLRDTLGVSSPTIHKAIRMTGDSVNAPTAIEEADALRKAFLEDDDD